MQISISIVLLSCAALLLRSFRNLEEQKLGIEPDHVLTARIALPDFRYGTGEKKMQFYLRAEEAVRSIPGVEAVGWSDSFPPGGWQGGQRYADFTVEGKPQPEPGTGGSIVLRRVTPDYFRALNIPIVHGRNFSEDDRNGAEQKVILSRLLASRMFPNEDPVGKRIHESMPKRWSTVVGIAENAKNSGLTQQDEPEMYALLRNVPNEWGAKMPVGEEMGGGAAMMGVETMLPPKVAEQWIHSQISQLDSSVPVEIEPLIARVTKLADRPRFATALLGYFALNGLLMAIIGLYGVISFMAASRTQEIGVRMALGADRADILRLMTWEGVRLIVAGCVVGLAVTLGVTRILSGLLFQVDPHDPGSLAVSLAMLGTVAIAATLIPARRAMKTDPMVALRCE